jgi:hypothetical protein
VGMRQRHVNRLSFSPISSCNIHVVVAEKLHPPQPGSTFGTYSAPGPNPFQRSKLTIKRSRKMSPFAIPLNVTAHMKFPFLRCISKILSCSSRLTLTGAINSTAVKSLPGNRN